MDIIHIALTFICPLMRTLWEKLARQNNLSYIPGNFFQKEYIEGVYRGYHLRLAHWDFGLEFILTLVETEPLPNHQHNEPVTPQQITRLLTTTPYLLTPAQGYLRIENGGRKIFYHHLQADTLQLENIGYLQDVFNDLSVLGDHYCISQGHIAVRNKMSHNSKHYERNKLSPNNGRPTEKAV